ncbi:hypothetical protein BS47DRAFT_1294320 [Hydnum rufescens UP504]|uniref:Uncharacterized protein n=1 Tax=Hydnum rufescens UP504 TaxID=1448309 RepID=A0A9P6B0B9_9AGAM|nr:hypothetical protein BS47DRAFT_1294320 [Hydnum rufescens UP504]
MTRIPQMFEAAVVLSRLLRRAGINHAFHGGFLAVLLGSPRDTEELFCIVDRGFRSVREAVANVETISVAFSTWSNRLFVTYSEPIPSIEIEIILAGERGPRRLDQTTIQLIQQVPFLTPTEFMRAKVKVWAISAQSSDATDIAFVLTSYWSSLDINRIPEDIERFIQQYPQYAASWDALRARYE